MIQKRLELLREQMKKEGVTVYVVPSSDCHESEYVCAHFQARGYITGFTGSAGTAVITLTEAGLWTDGRYFLQAEKQLEGSGFDLYRMGEPGVPAVEEYVKEHLEPGGILGFDGRVMGASRAETFVKAAGEKHAGLLVTEDLVGRIWEDRPDIPDAQVFVLEERWSGESTESKLCRVRREMKEAGADVHVLASLCDIAWLLNIRGDDIPHVPVALSFLRLTMEECVWYVRPSAVTEELRIYLHKLGVRVESYDRIYTDLENRDPGQRLLLDKKNVNYRLLTSVPEGTAVIDRRNPTLLMKAVKNETELANLRKAHLKEGLAFTRFIHWLKTHVGKEEITEISAAEYLDGLRKEQETCLEQSFAPICAYGANGAVVHYSATEESNACIRPEGFLLVDAGGQYLEGTTDTTRTIVLGALGEEEKRMFTAVCRGNLNLANARFLYGCTGANLDVLCREPLWQLAADYKHGTGHGVGYLLNVHEGPNTFRWKVPKGEHAAVLEPGMVTTDEPGMYVAGRYGIRTENELVCVKGQENEYGQFLEFENLTLVPIDLDAILPQEMTEREREYLNAYHQSVYQILAPHMNKEEREWLRLATREIHA
ncbi:MAG: aminopeptidase P family protein [Clostridiales bacterium]|nr:aminopeptidase P family protein [Clostridiales bacterium]